MNKQKEIELAKMIYNAKNIEGAQSHLTDIEQETLYLLLTKRCKQKTKDKLDRMLKLPLSLFPDFGIMRRVTFTNGQASYCAGQCYVTEIRTVRECFTK